MAKTSDISKFGKMKNIFLAILLSCGMISISHAEVVSYDDPWEGANRAIFKFNDTIDTYTLKPLAQGYDKVTPKPIQNLVSNFFNNLGEIRNAANALLQFKLGETATALGRFGLNSTVGMLGMVDVATPLGMEEKYEDFGLTLAKWGAPSGPYVVLPIFGPKTLRSGLGLYPDSALNPQGYISPDKDRYITKGIDLVNIRTHLLGSEELVVGDRYSFIRDAYLQRREYMITGELPGDGF